MKRFTTILGFAILALAVGASAQMQPPKPGPELKKLEYFVGNWKSHATLNMGPNAPKAEISASDTDEWMSGGFFVVNHSSFQGTIGTGEEIEIMGYDTDAKVYTYDSFNSNGQHEQAKGTMDGDTWTWNSDLNMGGQMVKTQYIQKILSPDSFSFKLNISPDGSNWSTVMEGTATKNAATSPAKPGK